MAARRRARPALFAAVLAAAGAGLHPAAAFAQEGVDPGAGGGGGVADEPVRLVIADREAVLDPARFEGRVGPVHAVVAFSRIPVDGDRDALDSLGVVLHQYLPHLAYYATVPAERAGDLLALPFVLAAEPLRAEWKARPKVAADPARALWRLEDGRRLAAVYFHPDGDPAEAHALLAAAGAEVVSESWRVNQRLLAALDPARVPALLEREEVRWLETGRLPRRTLNASAAQFHSVDEAQATPFGLDGSGVRVGVMDGDVVQDGHPDFGDRVTVAQTYGYGYDFHATHVTGTILGDGSSKAAAKGMAPAARSWNWSFYVGDPVTTKDYGFSTYGIDVDNNSWGAPTGWQLFGWTWLWFTNTDEFGAYLSIVGDLDSIAADRNTLICFAAGNDGWDDGYDGYGYIYYYYTGHYDVEPVNYGYQLHYGYHPPDGDGNGFRNLGAYASVKNGLGVGAVCDDGTVAGFSSGGPTRDGRIKPDVVAVGVDVLSTVPVDSHGTSMGTSMATPVVTGTAALIVQAWNESHGGADPRLDVLRGLLIHSTFDLGPAGPDYRYGFGGIDAAYAADLATKDGGGEVLYHRTGSISHGETREYLLPVTSSSAPLRATLCWTDSPTNPVAPKALVNDLDLSLVSPSGSVVYPWKLDPSNPGALATRGVNSVDTVEMAQAGSPAQGTWKVVVKGATVPKGPQPFTVWFSRPYTNVAPVANAGEDRFVSASLPSGRTLALSGTLSTDANGNSDIVLYEWDVDGDGSFTDPAGSLAGPTVSSHFPIGVHAVSLRVTDSLGLQDTDTLVVAVRNDPPVASLGPDRVLRANDPEGVVVTLDTSLCTDPQTTADIYSALWDTDDDGEFDDASGYSVELRLAPGPARVGVRVFDQGGLSSSAYANFTVVTAENVLGHGGKFKGSLGAVDDVDSFFFEALDGSALTLAVKAKSYARVRLFAPSGATVFDHDPGAGEFRFVLKKLPLAQTGWYWLEVAPRAAADTGSYALSLRVEPPPVAGKYREVLGAAPAWRSYPVPLLAGSRLVAKARGKKGVTDFVGNPFLSLRAPDGSELLTAAPGRPLKLAAAPETGTYELRVSPLNGEPDWGGFEITWKGKGPKDKAKIRELE